MPVLNPAELWQRTGRWDIEQLYKLTDSSGEALRAGDDARGVRHLPCLARDPLLQGAAADLVPHPDQGAGRAAAQERHPAHARVPDEGLLQPRPRRGGPGRELPAPHRGLQAHLRPLRARVLDGRVRRGHDGRRSAHTSSWRRAARGRTRSRCARAATTPPTWSWPARGRARRSSRSAWMRRSEIETPDTTTIEALAGQLGIDAPATAKAMVLVRDGEVVLVLVRGDDRHARAEGVQGAGRRVSGRPRRSRSLPPLAPSPARSGRSAWARG